MITLADIEAARDRIASRVRRTPVMAFTRCLVVASDYKGDLS